MSCGTGPINEVFGGTSWLVNSCEDVAPALVAEPNSPASPFIYFVYPSEAEKDRYVGEGEGIGDKQYTSAALAEIGGLSGNEIAAPIAVAKQKR